LSKTALLAAFCCLISLQLAAQSQPGTQLHAGKPAPRTSPAQGGDPAQLFQQGEAALQSGDLDQAERFFRGVLAVDPGSVGAYGNLGVVYMRRRQWPAALEALHHAEHLAPTMPGVQLNIGLAYFRQNDFRSAIPAFESVVRSVPTSDQANHLLGLCYFFTDRYADAVSKLEPLWDQSSNQLNYLYVLGIAASKANRPELEQRALGKMVATGQNTPEFHLLMGKAHINREEYDEAITELETAAKANPKLPFVHFNLGVAHLKKQELDKAKAEFLKDIALEPDVVYNYDQLGLVYSQQQQDPEAAKSLRKALQLDPNLASSHYELARVYQRLGKYPDALIHIDAANRLDPDNYPVHYVRGQILQRLGRTQEAKLEMQTTTRLMNALRSKRQKELYETPLPNPEVMQEPK
jgi:tetratricopeptide (TPR) repeat protein